MTLANFDDTATIQDADRATARVSLVRSRLADDLAHVGGFRLRAALAFVYDDDEYEAHHQAAFVADLAVVTSERARTESILRDLAALTPSDEHRKAYKLALHLIVMQEG